ncbi:MAG: FAD-dependent oxidoreductase, partial [Bdellovibrionales bacterium]|nr:FAD-dependent oxidoreductase [Bdellovibrionales bacterium]
ALLTQELAARDALMTFVVVGGGPTGVEIAGALAELRRHVLPVAFPELDFRRMRVLLVESSDRLLKAMSESAAREARRALESLDVELWLETGVAAYDGRVVRTREGKQLLSRTVVWTAGVMGAPLEGLPDASVERGRILVDAYSRIQGAAAGAGPEGIYALGDVAEMRTAELPSGHPMMAPPAMQQGRHLARNLVRAAHGEEPAPFRYRDKGSMATIGRARAVAEIRRLRLRGFPAWVMWLTVHLLYLMGSRNRLLVFVNWMWNYLSYDRGNRLIVRPSERRAQSAETASASISKR